MLKGTPARLLIVITAALAAGLLMVFGPGLQSPPGVRAVQSLTDDFADGTIDGTRWQPWHASNLYVSGAGPGGTVTESGGTLQVQLNAPGPMPLNTGLMQATSMCSLSGDFDVQVDYALSGWPVGSAQQHQAQLAVVSKSPANVSALVVIARADVNALGFHGYMRYQVPGTMLGTTGSSDTSGKLRIERIGSLVQEYYWNGAAWISLGSRTWVADSASLALKVSNDSDLTSETATASFDNLSVTAEAITCPITAGQIPSFAAAVSSNAPGAQADLTFSAEWVANSEDVTGGETKIPAGFDVADGATIGDGEETGSGTLAYDWLCTGTTVAIAVPPLAKRPPFAGERLRSRALVGDHAVDYIIEVDPATGGYVSRVYVSIEAANAPSAPIPNCPPRSGTEMLRGTTAPGGTPVLTNPAAPGLYPFLRVGRGSISGTLYTRMACVAIGGQIGVDFIDADGDCLLDSAPLITAAAAGGRLASPAMMMMLDPNPAVPDIDADGLPDGVEVTLVGSSPSVADTDADGAPDWNEAIAGSNPNVANSDSDSQLDAADNCPAATNEDQLDSDGDGPGNACDADDDNDGMLDAWETQYAACMAVLISDPLADPDSDGLSNFVEFGGETSPCPETDSDGDGCVDVEEVATNHVVGGQRNPADFWDFYDVDGSKSVGLFDALRILAHFGHGPTGIDGAGQNIADHNLLDRYIPIVAMGWLSAEADNGIGLADALANLRSFGDSCSGPPN